MSDPATPTNVYSDVGIVTHEVWHNDESQDGGIRLESEPDANVYGLTLTIDTELHRQELDSRKFNVGTLLLVLATGNLYYNRPNDSVWYEVGDTVPPPPANPPTPRPPVASTYTTVYDFSAAWEQPAAYGVAYSTRVYHETSVGNDVQDVYMVGAVYRDQYIGFPAGTYWVQFQMSSSVPPFTKSGRDIWLGQQHIPYHEGGNGAYYTDGGPFVMQGTGWGTGRPGGWGPYISGALHFIYRTAGSSVERTQYGVARAVPNPWDGIPGHAGDPGGFA